jgi:predicted porin
MKKSLLALAVLGAFAGTASAQSSVTIYGIVDASIVSMDNGAATNGRVTRMDSGRDSASRIGFKGAEDLGNGLKATFQLENGFSADNGNLSSASTLFSRQSWLGLEGNFGAIRLGRQNTPIKDALDVIDPFVNAGMAGSIDYFGYSTTAGGSTTPERVPNQALYASPNFGGFSGSASYIFGETRGDNSANNGYGARLGYANGPLNLQAAYSVGNTTTAGIDQNDEKNILVGGTYDFGVVKLHGGYKDTTVERNVAPGGDIVKVRSYLVGVTVPFGASKVRAYYINNDVRNAPNLDSKAVALSYSYALSKRTSLYTTYVRASNDSASDMGVVDGGTIGQNASGIAFGMKHTF